MNKQLYGSLTWRLLSALTWLDEEKAAPTTTTSTTATTNITFHITDRIARWHPVGNARCNGGGCPCNTTAVIPRTICSTSHMQTHSHSAVHSFIYSDITTGTCYHSAALRLHCMTLSAVNLMHMCVCVCVCVCVSVHAHAHTCKCTCVFVCVHVNVYECVCMCMNVQGCVYECVWIVHSSRV